MLRFDMPQYIREAPVVFRLDDGSLIMDAVPLIADQQLTYYGYELPLDALFGVDHGIEWDQKLIGLLTLGAAEAMLDQFEGLAITDGHEFIETGRRNEIAVGTFLRDATLDGMKVRSRALIYDATAIVKAETDTNELSIGGIGFMEPNPDRGTDGQPDFFIRHINLNHVALVENGRAGPEARLLNHKASLSHTQPKDGTMKITINGVEFDVPDAVASEIARQNGVVSDLTNTAAALTTQITDLTTARDTAQGRADGLATELETAQTALTNSAAELPAQAVQIANEHTTFVEQARRLGHTDELTLGEYDRAALMATILNSRGAKLPETPSSEYLAARWDAALEANGSTVSILDHAKPNGQNVEPIGVKTMNKVNASYFGAGKSKEA